jgi:hypothetical protein
MVGQALVMAMEGVQGKHALLLLGDVRVACSAKCCDNATLSVS